ncbi:tetratricopeptide repeat protein [uncultured Eudoraea sp.]|uniref:tetratricopeptide repeat protein n=1 Tax=uncultured Eudoraea sp. TaxID=1035614 RepID=UPI00262E1B35|nr:tetratricopeptide repeat protein [uncultured Eudoraea sp.]
MKKLLFLAALLLFWQLPAQQKFTSSQWQEDLRFLQETVHKDYPFLFKKVKASEFDETVEKFYTEIPKMQEHEVLVGFARIIGMFKYGHTRVSFSEGPVAYHSLPINLYQFPDGLYITAAHKDYESVVGAKITAIEGIPTDEVLKAIYPVVPAENNQFFKAYAGLYLIVPEVLHAQGITKTLKQDISLSLEKDGKSFDSVINATSNHDTPLQYGELKPESDWVGVRDQSQNPPYLKNLDKIYYYEYLPEQKAVYVRHSQIQDDPDENIPAFYERLFEFVENNEVERLILDVRLNGGGNNYKNKPIVTGIIKSQKINQTGKFFVIIGRRTFSACQNLVNELDNYTNAIFVGEPTGENINFYGDNRRVELPNSKLAVYLSFAWWQDKPQWENGDYTVPHLAVESSYDDYSTNKDPVLETALNFTSDNFIIDPMGYLTQLFMDEKFEFLATEAQRLVQDPAYKFFNFEAEFNKAGYQLLGSGQFEGALYVFEMNTKLFPGSANTWDSLAEGYWKAGDLVKAKEYYNKAIRIDPDGLTADNARRMLHEMEGESKQ